MFEFFIVLAAIICFVVKEVKAFKFDLEWNEKISKEKQQEKAWKDLIEDVELEERLLLYLLDENNRPEYIPKLQAVYNSLGHKRDITYEHFHRRMTTPQMAYDDPFDRRNLNDHLWRNRQEALSILMSEHGKLPVYAYVSGWGYHPAGNEEYRKDLLFLVRDRLERHHPGSGISVKYIETIYQKAYYWMIKDEHAYPPAAPSKESVEAYKKSKEYTNTTPKTYY